MTPDTDPARATALQLLTQVTEHRRMLSEVQPRILAPLDPGAKARATRLAADTLRWANRSDRMLGPFLRMKPEDLILNVLRLGVTELCQHQSAAHGVVNDLVALVKSGPSASKSGLVNAILRKVGAQASKWDDLPPPQLPKWLRKPVNTAYGKASLAAIEAAHAAGAATDISCKSDPAEWAKLLNGTLLPTGSVRLKPGVELTSLPGYAEGAWWVQDAAAALPANILAAQQDETILDLCAAPGGKTMQLAAAGAKVTALDVSKTRMGRVHENLARTGLAAKAVVADCLTFEHPPFDAILLDAPCSATGTIRRHPDLPFAKAGMDFSDLIQLQRKMIDKASSLLRPGGRLVFCTCSLLPEEGEEQAAYALSADLGLELDKAALEIQGVDPAWIGDIGLRTRPDYWPELGGMDGFFMAAFRKA